MRYVTKRADSDVYQFVFRTPTRVREKLKGKPLLINFSYIYEEEPFTIRPTVGEKIKFSLKTTDKKVAQARELEALKQIECYVDAATSSEIKLSHHDLVKMSRAIYEAYVEIHHEEPGPRRDLAEHKALSRAVREGRIASLHPLTMGEISGSDANELFGVDLTAGINALPEGPPDRKALEARFGELADYLLARYRMAVDDDTRGRLLLQCASASIEAAWRLKDNADGDYGPDTRIERFGAAFVPPKPEQPKAAANVTITGLFEDWWKEAEATGLKPSTHESYGTAIAGFVKFLGHDNAKKVTPENVLSWKDFRLASINPRSGKPISPSTVKGSDLSGLKTVFAWAVINRRVPTNPTIDVTIKLGKRSSRTKVRGFSHAEAKAVLEAADEVVRGLDRPKTYSAKRWVPWLCAYSGARVGEIVQLRKQDIRQEAGHWVVLITPDAGTVKTDEAREFVLHPHLVEKGFPDFVSQAEPGHLFVTPSKKTGIAGPVQGITNRLGEQARKIVKDPLVKPNHGWRHRFKTLCRNVGIDPRVMDAIQGHAARTAGDDYGDVTIEAMALAMAKFPWQGLPANEDIGKPASTASQGSTAT